MIPNLFPKYVRVRSSGNLIQNFDLGIFGTISNNEANVTFARHESLPVAEWWQLNEYTVSSMINPTDELDTENYIQILSFNDRVAPGAFSVINSYGIIGIYLSFILVIHQVIRILTVGISRQIMFLELPSTDRLFKLCKDIYLVREAGELKLEEELFAKLVFLYRSPEALMRITRFPDKNKDKIE